jgi:hypothetical protein
MTDPLMTDEELRRVQSSYSLEERSRIGSMRSTSFHHIDAQTPPRPHVIKFTPRPQENTDDK